MGLADRRGRERMGIELGECLLDGLGQLRAQDFRHLLVGQAADVRVEVRQLGGQRFRKQVAASGGDLPELDEHAAGTLQYQAEAAGEVG